MQAAPVQLMPGQLVLVPPCLWLPATPQRHVGTEGHGSCLATETGQDNSKLMPGQAVSAQCNVQSSANQRRRRPPPHRHHLESGLTCSIQRQPKAGQDISRCNCQKRRAAFSSNSGRGAHCSVYCSGFSAAFLGGTTERMSELGCWATTPC